MVTIFGGTIATYCILPKCRTFRLVAFLLAYCNNSISMVLSMCLRMLFKGIKGFEVAFRRQGH
jgi:hypothetical protein